MMGWIWSTWDQEEDGDVLWGGVNLMLQMRGVITGKAQQAKEARTRLRKMAKKDSWKAGGWSLFLPALLACLHSPPSYCEFPNDNTRGVRLSNPTPPAWVSMASLTSQKFLCMTFKVFLGTLWLASDSAFPGIWCFCQVKLITVSPNVLRS